MSKSYRDVFRTLITTLSFFQGPLTFPHCFLKPIFFHLCPDQKMKNTLHTFVSSFRHFHTAYRGKCFQFCNIQFHFFFLWMFCLLIQCISPDATSFRAGDHSLTIIQGQSDFFDPWHWKDFLPQPAAREYENR